MGRVHQTTKYTTFDMLADEVCIESQENKTNFSNGMPKYVHDKQKLPILQTV